MSAPIGALDLGTNSFRLLVVDDHGGELCRRATITRLGEGVDRTGRLSEEAIARGLAVLSSYASCMAELGVRSARAAATSAARDASNREEFLGRAQELLGFPVELIGGEEEARLSFLGATSWLRGGGEVVVADVGGGSTELAVGEPGGRPRAVVSVPVGCVRLTERYLAHDPPLASEFEAAEREVAVTLAEVVAQLQPSPEARLVGVAGTVTSLAAMELGLVSYDPDLVHASRLSVEAIRRWREVLFGEDAESRAKHPGLEPGRVSTILGGVVVVEGVLKALRIATMIVSEKDILDGLAMSVLEAQREGGANTNA